MTISSGDYLIPVGVRNGRKVGLRIDPRGVSGQYAVPCSTKSGRVVYGHLDPMTTAGQAGIPAVTATGAVVGLFGSEPTRVDRLYVGMPRGVNPPLPPVYRYYANTDTWLPLGNPISAPTEQEPFAPWEHNIQNADYLCGDESALYFTSYTSEGVGDAARYNRIAQQWEPMGPVFTQDGDSNVQRPKLYAHVGGVESFERVHGYTGNFNRPWPRPNKTFLISPSPGNLWSSVGPEYPSDLDGYVEPGHYVTYMFDARSMANYLGHVVAQGVAWANHGTTPNDPFTYLSGGRYEILQTRIEEGVESWQRIYVGNLGAWGDPLNRVYASRNSSGPNLLYAAIGQTAGPFQASFGLFAYVNGGWVDLMFPAAPLYPDSAVAGFNHFVSMAFYKNSLYVSVLPNSHGIDGGLWRFNTSNGVEGEWEWLSWDAVGLLETNGEFLVCVTTDQQDIVKKWNDSEIRFDQLGDALPAWIRSLKFIAADFPAVA